MLKALVDSDFITKYTPLANARKEDYYRLCDPFCAFYLRFVEGNRNTDPQFWQNSQNLPAVVAWRGFAFEQVCFNHIPQIKAALGVSGVVSKESALLVRGDKDSQGGQIDLLIDRADNVLNLCEMKFYKKPYSVSQQDLFDFEDRIELLATITKSKKNIHFTLVTTFGLKHNEHSGVVQKVVTLEDLFR